MTKPAYTGQSLLHLINTTADSRPPLIAGFVHERSIILVSSDPGAGKSTITACWMAQASAGLPVFGQLFVPRPLTIYYVPFERGAYEIAERLSHMQRSIVYETDNIFINDSFIGMNVNKDSHADDIIGRMKTDLNGRHVDIIILDPIYQAVPGGLSKDESATQFTRFSSRVQAEFDCAIYLNHHTSRDRYSSHSGEKIDRDDPFYGSQWLKAHCTGAFILKKVSEEPILVLKKDNHSVLLKQIALSYDPADYTVFMSNDDSNMANLPVHDRLLMIYRTLYNDRRSVTITQLSTLLMGVSHSHLRRVMSNPPFSTSFTTSKSIGKATLYTPTTPL